MKASRWIWSLCRNVWKRRKCRRRSPVWNLCVIWLRQCRHRQMCVTMRRSYRIKQSCVSWSRWMTSCRISAMREMNHWNLCWRRQKNLYFSYFRTGMPESMCQSDRLLWMHWRKLKKHRRARELLREFRPDLLIWIINCPDCSHRISFWLRQDLPWVRRRLFWILHSTLHLRKINAPLFSALRCRRNSW